MFAYDVIIFRMLPGVVSTHGIHIWTFVKIYMSSKAAITFSLSTRKIPRRKSKFSGASFDRVRFCVQFYTARICDIHFPQ